MVALRYRAGHDFKGGLEVNRRQPGKEVKKGLSSRGCGIFNVG